MVLYYKKTREIEAVVSGFESCSTAKEDFTHRSHLTVAAYYLHSSNELDAIQRMRAGLLRFLDHHGIGRTKYHETITIFWIRTVWAFVERLGPKVPLLEMTNAVTESLANPRLVFEYYSEELLRTDKARNSWVPPDLKEL